MKIMNVLKEQYKKDIAPQLKKEFEIKNAMAVPKLTKITVNVGVGRAAGDKKVIENVVSNITRITGQKPVLVKARKSISNFKLREGMIVGVMVTLRGKSMYDFMYKLVNITLPRVRDFQGIDPKAVDTDGNLNIGFKEHIVFPEISSDEVERVHGLEVAVTTSTTSREQGYRLLELMGVPFKKKNK
ncbi:MAG: 50S ribosomal protein L5 [bacterium]|nr:50S ribosomal protein L5 [bacterium]